VSFLCGLGDGRARGWEHVQSNGRCHTKSLELTCNVGCRTTAGNTREGTRHGLLQSSCTLMLRLSNIYRSVPHLPTELTKTPSVPLIVPSFRIRPRLQYVIQPIRTHDAVGDIALRSAGHARIIYRRLSNCIRKVFHCAHSLRLCECTDAFVAPIFAKLYRCDRDSSFVLCCEVW